MSALEKAEEIMVAFRAQALKQVYVEDSHGVRDDKLASGEEEIVTISMELLLKHDFCNVQDL